MSACMRPCLARCGAGNWRRSREALTPLTPRALRSGRAALVVDGEALCPSLSAAHVACALGASAEEARVLGVPSDTLVASPQGMLLAPQLLISPAVASSGGVLATLLATGSQQCVTGQPGVLAPGVTGLARAPVPTSWQAALLSCCGMSRVLLPLAPLPGALQVRWRSVTHCARHTH